MGETTSFSGLDNDERQRLLSKLTKLKALSECPTGNVNETATAAAAMTRLMLEYQIEMAELQVESDGAPDAAVTEELDGKLSKRGFPLWQSDLLNHIAKANDCITFVTGYKHRDNPAQRLSLHRLIGARSDIQNTRNLYLFCLVEIERLCKRWNPHAPQSQRNDFRIGAARGIGEKVLLEREAVLAEERARAMAKGQSSRALALFDRKSDSALSLAADIGLVSRQAHTRAVSPLAYQAGYQAGSNLILPDDSGPRALAN